MGVRWGGIVAVVVATAWVGVSGGGASAQEVTGEAGRDRLRIFLDCNAFCDETHLRTEITWIDWVRDRTDSDVHILVSDESTGSGGRSYTLAFLGRGTFEGIDDEIRFATSGDATQDERRDELVTAIGLGLGRYVVRTPGRRGIRVQTRQEPGGGRGPGGPPGAPGGEADDPWNSWVFNVGLNGSVNGQSSQSSSSYGGSLSANRIAEAWKITMSGRYSRSESTFQLTDTEVTSVRETWSTTGLLVRSLGPQLSLGARASAGKSTFTNQDFQWSLKPGIEYNLFPYAESTRRQFTVQYLVGLSHWDYKEETIYGVTEETRPNHELAVNLNLVEPWGQSFVSLSGVQYLHDTDFYRVNLFGSLDIRLFRGFSFRVSGSYAWVADQLYLEAGDLSDEDILLQQRARRTNHEYFTSFGISYRFGSIFNNVVNPRFGGGGGGFFFF